MLDFVVKVPLTETVVVDGETFFLGSLNAVITSVDDPTETP